MLGKPRQYWLGGQPAARPALALADAWQLTPVSAAVPKKWA
jgi:hypothetical protein